ncbi:LuxR family transcriptional regulator [Pedomonas mirosovicensis]|uniref:LuxR family transcriptional regulator n=1 Tax=Pedomonas mirosovicensis TaxID=2908641 RepID=UPI002168EDFD|nr:LuxR family transcriptional regulator [Pedomonas mirosovicensis]MCH8685822.1 LuxR family transcriptional regulator [Pedomonas mirosovicensis]
MDYYTRVCGFLEDIRAVRTEKELTRLVAQVLQEFGFRHYAIISHVDLLAPPQGAVRIIDYPQSWKERSAQQRYFADDPVLLTAQRMALPFTWEDIPRHLDLTRRQQAILEEARAAGLAHGYTVPIHVPGQVSGSCSFSYEAEAVDPAAFPAAHYIGIYAFNAALKLSGRAAERPEQAVRLTNRQRQCLALAARGKSDWSIGQLLTLSQQTVHMHIELAKNRYGVSSRVEAVVRALFDGELAFADILREEGASFLAALESSQVPPPGA